MIPAAENRFTDMVAAWVDLCHRRALWVLTVSVLLCGLATAYLAENLRIDTDTEDMLSADLSFRQDAIRLDEAFPQFEDTLLVVLEADNADNADDAVAQLAAALSARRDVFAGVYAPRTDPFLRKNGFLYMDTGALEDLADRLSAAQPFLGTLWQAPNLSGLADMVALLGEGITAGEAAEAARVLNEMADVAERVWAGESASLVWSDLILGDGGAKTVRRLITVKPTLDYGSLNPAADAMDAVRHAFAAIDAAARGVRLRMTGSAAIEAEELASVEQGMGFAGVLSVVVVTAVLLVGLRSIGTMLALLLTLAMGLLWTAAFAILAVGALNLISVAFAVLFVGLSVDFGIHFALRAREALAHGHPWPDCLSKGAGSVALPLGLCTVTSAIAFFSFLPTAYEGLAELGLIAGVGMVVALAANLTVLPALMRLLVPNGPPPARLAPHASLRSAERFASPIVMIGILSTLAAAWVATGARFDFDPMNLRDREAPAMRTLFDLMQAGDAQPYSAEVLSDADGADALAGRLATLPSVARVESIADLIPAEQQAKRDIVDGMALFLGPAFFAPRGEVRLSHRDENAAMVRLYGALNALSGSELEPAAKRLARALDGSSASAVNTALFRSLPGRLDLLSDALSPEVIDIETLPVHLKRRFIAEDGTRRLEVIPAGDLRDSLALSTFAAEVREVAAHATGAPIIVVEAGDAVLTAFAQAMAISFGAIAIVLWLVLRRAVDVIMVFAPVCVAAVWTLAVSASFGISFNFANVIVLPLLFGLSVDFGVHLILRGREEAGSGVDRGDPMSTVTPRAILLSALTTLGSFGSIMLSGHPGTASMGLLLTISIGLSLIAILLFLPALMTLERRLGGGA